MKELAFTGMLYIEMLDGETAEEADERLYETLENAGVTVGSYQSEERED